jgi:hypothetical protein
VPLAAATLGLDNHGMPDEPEEGADDTGCTRCDAPLVFLGRKDFHEGGTGFGILLGPLQELLVNRERIEMWACEACGHVEFFMPVRR